MQLLDKFAGLRDTLLLSQILFFLLHLFKWNKKLSLNNKNSNKKGCLLVTNITVKCFTSHMLAA